MDAAMSSAVSGLLAESTALSNISNNLSNSQTSGYKAVATQFTSLLTELSNGATFTTGGVSATARQNVLAQGTITGTSVTTDMAISGNGMFVVSYGLSGGQVGYTRNGAFDTDSSGNLYLSGTNYYLEGWPTDTNGTVTSKNSDNEASLETVNINKYNSSAVATTGYTMSANFPAAAQNSLGTVAYTNSSGVTEDLSMTYVQTASDPTAATPTTTYTVTIDSPSSTTISDGTTNSASQLLYSVTVDNTGTITNVVGMDGATGYTLTGLPSITPADITAGSSVTLPGATAAANSVWSTLTTAIGSGYSKANSMTVYDSLGVEQSFGTTWTAAGDNSWIMTVASPTNAAGTKSTGQLINSAGSVVSSYSYKVTFNSDGTLGSFTALPTYDSTGAVTGTAPMSSTSQPELQATWTDGAAVSTGSQAVVLNLGTTGKTDGLSQFSTTQSTSLSISVKSTEQNGVQYGSLTGVSIDTSGNVIAAYDNGQKVPIYKIPVATFPNENGLTEKSDGVYEQSSLSGNYTLNEAGNNGAGSIKGQSLESSTVNTTVEFSNMITAQQAYSSASQVISTDKKMFDSLISVIQ
ncbi:flagellar hook-basal body complex protein [Telmatospirillum sp.]|uniref:flagellar hook-basal body complex protein n=1 Tax=Telmatospirillum sp. TaxID=2079197 RepID=UPI00284102C8|nr:flagellar hook-basal body complex protein [Telmatospirillum sp.]MDR3438539.1 flagellar hook-basal body complex protein [Telmatospirillum sp.]